MRATTQLDGVLFPLGVLGFSQHCIHRRPDSHNSDGIRVDFPEHSTNSFNLQCLFERHFFCVNPAREVRLSEGVRAATYFKSFATASVTRASTAVSSSCDKGLL